MSERSELPNTSEPGIIEMGSDPTAFWKAVTQYETEQAEERAAALNVSATQSRLTTVASLREAKAMRCTRCRAETPYLTGPAGSGLCAQCDRAVPIVVVAQTTRCEICDGTGEVSVPDGDSYLLERPLVPGEDDS